MRNWKKIALAVLCACALLGGGTWAWAAFSFTNPYPAAGVAGSKVADGVFLNILESNLVHVDSGGAADALVNKGDPVLLTGGIGIIGVAFNSVDAATDRVTVDTEGIYNLTITPLNGTLDIGELVYINTSTGLIGNTTGTAIPFGYSLSETDITSGTTSVIPIKLARDADDE